MTCKNCHQPIQACAMLACPCHDLVYGYVHESGKHQCDPALTADPAWSALVAEHAQPDYDAWFASAR